MSVPSLELGPPHPPHANECVPHPLNQRWGGGGGQHVWASIIVNSLWAVPFLFKGWLVYVDRNNTYPITNHPLFKLQSAETHTSQILLTATSFQDD